MLKPLHEQEKNILHILYIIAIALTTFAVVGCTESVKNDANILVSQRMWSLRKIAYPGGYSVDYPNASGTYLTLYANDTTLYLCHWKPTGKFTAILPQEKTPYTLISKEGGEYLYLENGNPRPLTVVNDTTVNIQINGIVYTWSVEQGIDEQSMTEICNLLVGIDYEPDKEYDRYIFTKKEHELEEANSMQHLYIAALLIALTVGAFCLIRTYHNKRRIEAEVRRLKDEREDRPQIVVEALKNVEEEWLSSEVYARLRKQIECGTLSPDDWAMMERQLNKVYPGFTHTLEGLYRMSQIEHRVCMLIKMRVTPSEMAAVLNKEASSISTTRSRLYYKISGKKGGAKDWDEFIMGL